MYGYAKLICYNYRRPTTLFLFHGLLVNCEGVRCIFILFTIDNVESNPFSQAKISCMKLFIYLQDTGFIFSFLTILPLIHAINIS